MAIEQLKAFEPSILDTSLASKAEGIAPDAGKMLAPFLNQPKDASSTRIGPSAFEKGATFISKQADGPKMEWTVVVDLAANQEGQGPRGHLGAEDKKNRLLDLAKSTEGKSVTIVAQAIEPRIPSANGEEQKSSEPNLLKRYIIRNGAIEELPSSLSNGFGNDLTKLLQLASQNASSDKIVLAINSHGMGNSGLSGDNGNISMTDFQKAVRDGIAGSGHERLDLLDFDACLMAQTDVLNKTRPIATRLVASSEIEDADTKANVDGQNLNAWIKDLLADPSMDAAKLGRTIIAEADKGANDDPKSRNHGTEFLALFNLDKSAAFENSLDRLGQVLSSIVKKEGGRETIEKTIDTVPLWGTSLSSLLSSNNQKAQPERRDLRLFLDCLEQAEIGNKTSHSASDLKNSISEVKRQLSDLTEALHSPKQPYAGPPNKSMDRLTGYNPGVGGLAAFLPPSWLFDTEARVNQKMAVSGLLRHCNANDDVSIRKFNADGLQATVQLVQSADAALLNDAPTARTWEETKAAITNLKSSLNGTDEMFLKASENACKSTAKLLAMPPYVRMKDSLKEELSPEKLYIKENVANEGGWNEFIQSLKPGTNSRRAEVSEDKTP